MMRMSRRPMLPHSETKKQRTGPRCRTLLVIGLLLWVPLSARVADAEEGGDDTVTVTLCEVSWKSALKVISYIYDDAQIAGPARIPACDVSIQEIDRTREELRRTLLTRFGVEV